MWLRDRCITQADLREIDRYEERKRLNADPTGTKFLVGFLVFIVGLAFGINAIKNAIVHPSTPTTVRQHHPYCAQCELQSWANRSRQIRWVEKEPCEKHLGIASVALDDGPAHELSPTNWWAEYQVSCKDGYIMDGVVGKPNPIAGSPYIQH